MDHREVGRLWDGNADAWTKLARAGYDVYRDGFNTPAFIDMLPDVTGLHGLDIGCGEGSNTREVARRGARMTAIDISTRFVEYATQAERADPLGITYQIASAVELPFADGAFDFATAFMCLMDVPENDVALREAFRVIRPGGFLQFSITHPCFDTPHRRNLRDEHRRTYAIEVGRYFDRIDGQISEWLFSAAPAEAKAGLRPFRVPRFHKPIGEWLNAVIAAAFVIECVSEPKPTEAQVAAHPDLQDAGVVAYFLHVRARKPAWK